GRRNVAFLFIREIEAADSQLGRMKELFGGPVIANEEMDHADAQRLLLKGCADAVGFGRQYIANPDLAERLAIGADLNEPIPATFYAEGALGYTDYPALSSVE